MIDAHPHVFPSFPQISSPSPVQQLEFHDSSPMSLRRSSLNDDDDDDDGFLDSLDDNMEVRAYVFEILSKKVLNLCPAAVSVPLLSSLKSVLQFYKDT